MRLADLNPRWFNTSAGRSGMGVTFDCPHCRTQRIGVAFANPLDGGPPDMLGGSKGDASHAPTSARLWARTGDTFDTLSLSPSIDVSHAGHWHGFIRKGDVY